MRKATVNVGLALALVSLPIAHGQAAEWEPARPLAASEPAVTSGVEVAHEWDAFEDNAVQTSFQDHLQYWSGAPGTSPGDGALPGCTAGGECGYAADGCGTCATAECWPVCYEPVWQVYGDYLFMRPGNDKVSYAVTINGAIVPPAGAPPVQVGHEAVADIQFHSGFRAGASRALSECADVAVTYSHLYGNTLDRTATQAPLVIRSLVNHPGSWAAPVDFLDAQADYGLGFKTFEVDYRRTLLIDDRSAVRYLVGMRYADLDQWFRSRFSNAVTIETVDADIGFDGGGVRIGLEGERLATPSGGLLLYGRGIASLVAGEFSSTYIQTDNQRGAVVSTGWTEDRVVPILDLELGVGWVNRTGCLRLTAGYMFSAWFNVIEIDEFVNAVRANNSVAADDTLTFDGLVLRTEFRF